MELNEYLAHFDAILAGEVSDGMYADPHFIDYTKLNHARQRRWSRNLELEAETLSALKAIGRPQKWILITEAWCGDSAHNMPFIAEMAAQNPLIDLEIQLRDSPPFLIEKYLTNGGKSIPILVVRDEDENDLCVWGPRPKGGQAIINEAKLNGTPMDLAKADLQKWYNADKGLSIQHELLNLLKSAKSMAHS
jgi:hypothetical protein